MARGGGGARAAALRAAWRGGVHVAGRCTPASGIRPSILLLGGALARGGTVRGPNRPRPDRSQDFVAARARVGCRRTRKQTSARYMGVQACCALQQHGGSCAAAEHCCTSRILPCFKLHTQHVTPQRHLVGYKQGASFGVHWIWGIGASRCRRLVHARPQAAAVSSRKYALDPAAHHTEQGRRAQSTLGAGQARARGEGDHMGYINRGGREGALGRRRGSGEGWGGAGNWQSNCYCSSWAASFAREWQKKETGAQKTRAPPP